MQLPLCSPYKIPEALSYSPTLDFSYRKPITILQAEVNTQKEQFFNLKHSRTLARFSNLWFAIRSTRSPGIFPQSAENAFLFQTGFSHQTNKTLISFSFHHHKAALQQNGGISDSIISSDGFSLLSNNRALSDPILLAAKTRNYETGTSFTLKNFFNKADTIYNGLDSTNYSLNHQGWFWHGMAKYDLDYYYFEEERNNAETIYPVFRNSFYDSTLTRDEFRLAKLSIAAGLGFQSEKQSFKSSLLADITDRYQTFHAATAYSLFLHNQFSRSIQNKLSVQLNLSNGLSGYNAGDIHSGAALFYDIDSLKKRSIRFKLTYNNVHAPILLQDYFSNSFAWTFNLNKTQSLNPELLFIYNNFHFFSGFRSITNLAYYDTAGFPVTSGRFAYLYAGMHAVAQNKFFFAEADVLYQHENSFGQVLAIPQFTGKSMFGFKALWFKSALNLRAGIDLIASTAFYGKFYIPETGAWVLQNKMQTGNYLFADFFIDFRVQTLSGFIKLEHINDGLWPGSYPAFGYAQALSGRLLRLGLIWMLVD